MVQHGGVTRDEAVALFDRRRAAWLAEDVDGYLACFAPDIDFRGPAGEPVYGLDAYASLIAKSLEVVRPVAFDFHEIAVHEDRVLAEWTIALDVRADGRHLSYRGMSVCTIRDGLISWWREYYDPSLLTRRSTAQ
jgi:limonene-1,2-epoxide hydrolase